MIDSIIYIRTSTDDQEPKNQIKACEKLSNGEYRLLEDKQSAFKDNKDRESFEEAKRLIKSGVIRHFIAWDLDRIYRNRVKLKQFFEFCKLYKCEIHSVNQQWLEQLNQIPQPFNEIMHELMLNLMGWLAEDESKKKSERVKAAVKEKNGVTLSYKGNKWGRKTLPTQAVNKIINLRNEGNSIPEISRLVTYADKNNNPKNPSVGVIHKLLKENKEKLHIKKIVK